MTPELKRGIDALKREFAAEIADGTIRHLGTTNCRYKNNNPNHGWSEHAWPNAVDVMLRRGSDGKADPAAKKVGDRIAAWMRSRPDLWSEVFWQIAAHYDHVHGTANPRRNYDNKQVPPCAGGPAIQPSTSTGDEDLAHLTDAQQKALADWLDRLEDAGSNVGYVTYLIPDVKKGIVTHDELQAAMKAVQEGTVDSYARRLAKRALTKIQNMKDAL